MNKKQLFFLLVNPINWIGFAMYLTVHPFLWLGLNASKKEYVPFWESLIHLMRTNYFSPIYDPDAEMGRYE